MSSEHTNKYYFLESNGIEIVEAKCFEKSSVSVIFNDGKATKGTANEEGNGNVFASVIRFLNAVKTVLFAFDILFGEMAGLN